MTRSRPRRADRGGKEVTNKVSSGADWSGSRRGEVERVTTAAGTDQVLSPYFMWSFVPTVGTSKNDSLKEVFRTGQCLYIVRLRPDGAVCFLSTPWSL